MTEIGVGRLRHQKIFESRGEELEWHRILAVYSYMFPVFFTRSYF